jgi:hypothetical protein
MEDTMRLVVKQSDTLVNEFEFGRGPIYIGRHTNSQIFLNHGAVSRQHAVIFESENGSWMVEDLGSANKTFLNDKAIHKAAIKSGDCIRITEFTIEVDLEEEYAMDKAIDLTDTLSRTAYDFETAPTTEASDVIIREPDAGRAPAMRLPSRRLADFSEATEAISKAGHLDELLLSLLDITLEHFSAYHTWCALRVQPSGPMTSHAGRQRDGGSLEVSEIGLSDKIMQAVEKTQYLVIPRVPAKMEKEEGIHSAMVAPIMHSSGCLGVVYVDNAVGQARYSLGDLDYLTLLTTHTAAMLKKL